VVANSCCLHEEIAHGSTVMESIFLQAEGSSSRLGHILVIICGVAALASSLLSLLYATYYPPYPFVRRLTNTIIMQVHMASIV
jgi:hypothetical protein